MVRFFTSKKFSKKEIKKFREKSFSSRKMLFSIAVILLSLNGVFLGLYEKRSTLFEEDELYSELQTLQENIQSGRSSFKDISNYFQDLANKKGAEYAFDVLKTASLPPNTDLHLLGHVVGDALYEQKGVSGMGICTHDFRNACSHSIVVGAFYEEGEGSLPKIKEACQQAPGGKGAYGMCYHGFGHGILAYLGYDLKEAIEICEKTGTLRYNNQEFTECVGGSVMELVGGGFHDREAWKRQREKYLKDDDPLYPCNSDFMPEIARPKCYVYLTPHLFQVVDGNLARPTPEVFDKAFPLCNKIPEAESRNREACYGGFGKEFVVLAQYRDIRKIENMTNEQLQTVYKWCILADDKDGVTSCILDAVRSLYWGGENDRSAAIRFCGVIDDAYYQHSCITQLIQMVGFYINDRVYRKEFCKEIPDSYSADCKRLLIR